MTESGENPPQNPTPDDRTPHDAAPKDAAPEATVPEDTAPKDTPPKDAAPKDVTPEDAAPEDTPPKDPGPEDTAPKDTPPKDAAPKDVAPEDTPPKDPGPEAAASKDAPPEGAAPKKEPSQGPPRQEPPRRAPGPPPMGMVPPIHRRPGGVKKSSVIKLGMLGGLSTLVVGFCVAQNRYEEVNADCVDTSSRQADGSYAVVSDDYCDDTRYHGSHGAYGWYYGGARLAGRVINGTTIKPSGSQISTRSGRVIQRGGFGFHVGGGG
ncbi:hypothetical protein [Planotetraspora silvatica]|uniref:hypothetical protein n=1 Tax=Planotetraspora silvatica TaxID=234614 RepID=UPI0031DCF268